MVFKQDMGELQMRSLNLSIIYPLGKVLCAQQFVLFPSKFSMHTTCCLISSSRILLATPLCFLIHAKRAFHSQRLERVREQIVYAPFLFCYYPSFDPQNLLHSIQIESTSNNNIVLFYLCKGNIQIHNLWYLSMSRPVTPHKRLNQVDEWMPFLLCFQPCFDSRNMLLIRMENISNNSLVFSYSCIYSFSSTTFGTCP